MANQIKLNTPPPGIDPAAWQKALLTATTNGQPLDEGAYQVAVSLAQQIMHDREMAGPNANVLAGVTKAAAAANAAGTHTATTMMATIQAVVTTNAIFGGITFRSPEEVHAYIKNMRTQVGDFFPPGTPERNNLVGQGTQFAVAASTAAANGKQENLPETSKATLSAMGDIEKNPVMAMAKEGSPSIRDQFKGLLLANSKHADPNNVDRMAGIIYDNYDDVKKAIAHGQGHDYDPKNTLMAAKDRKIFLESTVKNWQHDPHHDEENGIVSSQNCPDSAENTFAAYAGQRNSSRNYRGGIEMPDIRKASFHDASKIGLMPST